LMDFGLRRKEGSKCAPVGSLIWQNEPPVSIGSHIQQSEPIGDKDGVINLALIERRVVVL
jgi:hypothetical protein